MFNQYRFNNICRKIKEIKIQGATDVARAALKAYYLIPSEKSKKILLSLRPTEPMLSHIIDLAGNIPKEKILLHFSESQNKINSEVFKLIKNNSVIFTHCHSSNVVNSLIYAHKKGKIFEVYNTETRPLFQGRKTAKELSRAGINVTQFVDSAVRIALSDAQGKEEKTRKVNLVLLGADALLNDSVINKVGSGMISEIAHDEKIPVYIIADSWKYAHKSIKLEQRNFKEIWNSQKNKIHMKNPAFEAIPKKYISGIISEFGLMSYESFLKRVKK